MKKFIKELGHVLKMFIYGLLSKKFLVMLMIVVPWAGLIVFGKHEIAERFNEVIYITVPTFFGADIAQTVLPRKGSTGLQHQAKDEVEDPKMGGKPIRGAVNPRKPV